MLSAIVLLNNELDVKYAAKPLLDCNVLEMAAHNMHEAGIEKVCVVNKELVSEYRGVEICSTLYDAISLVGWEEDGDLVILDGLYPNLKTKTYKELFEMGTSMVEGRHILKLKLSELKDINELEFELYDIDAEELEKIENNRDLADYTRHINKEIVKKHIDNGVYFVDRKCVYIGPFVKIAEGVKIYPDVVLEGDTVIGKGTSITNGSHLVNAKVGEECKIISSRISDSSIGNKVSIGPCSHLRMNCEVGDAVRIGNYVEFKNTKFGYKSRCAHLSYVGDSVVGEDVNIGCGVVTVNYDGAHKHKTEIGDHAFVGSNANLIAPIKVGAYAMVAAGSTVNHDVFDGDMGIARCRQETKQGFGFKYINKEK